MDISRIFILVEFSRILGLVELDRLFKYRVDVSRDLRLVDFNGFFRY